MLSKKDSMILAELDVDSSRSLSKISRACGMSQQLAGYRMRRLRELGIIKGFYSLVDYSRFGQTCFRSYFPVSYRSADEFRKLIGDLSSNPHVVGIDECGGRWDISLTVLAGNASRFNKILKDIIASHPSLKDFDVVTNVVTHEFGRKYLRGGAAGSGVIIGGDREPVELSATDLMVIRETFSNPRKTAVQVSSSAGVHPRTVRKSLDRLRSQGILKGFSPVIDVQKLGRSRSRMMIKYRNITPVREKELVSYCRDHASAVSLNKVLGSWDMEIDIEARPGEPLRSCIMGIRERFEDIIRETETIEMFSNHKKALITREALGV